MHTRETNEENKKKLSKILTQVCIQQIQRITIKIQYLRNDRADLVCGNG